MEFKIAVGRILQYDSIGLSPDHKGELPVSKLTLWWAQKRDSIPLDVGSSVVSIETETTPVVVSVVGVGAKLQ